MSCQEGSLKREKTLPFQMNVFIKDPHCNWFANKISHT